MECLGEIEKFIHNEKHDLPVLVEAGLMHVQFESIHPFLDGNGRLGHLLITLLLCAKGALSEPLLYPSLFLKIHRSRYYELLQRVRSDGAWEDWLAFFLEGVASTAKEADRIADRTVKLFAKDRSKIEKLGRASESALRVHELMQTNPYLRIRTATKALKLTVPTVTSALNHLMRIGYCEGNLGKQRDRLFAYSRYVRMDQRRYSTSLICKPLSQYKFSSLRPTKA